MALSQTSYHFQSRHGPEQGLYLREGKMNKEKVKKILASFCFMGLIAGVGMMSTGCACAKKEAKQEAVQDTQVEAAADSTQADSTAALDQ